MSWNLIKSEFAYYKYLLIFLSMFFFIVSIVFLMWGAKDLEDSVPAYQMSLIAVFLVVWGFRFTILQKEKRDRIHKSLPLSDGTIACYRVFSLPLYWLLLSIIFILCNLLVQGIMGIFPLFWFLLSLTGFILAINAAPLLQRDLQHIFMAKYQRSLIALVWACLFVSFYLIFYFLIIPLKNFGLFSDQKVYFQESMSSADYSLAFLCVGLLMSFVNVLLFKKRKVYTE